MVYTKIFQWVKGYYNNGSLTFNPEFAIVIFIHYKPRIAVAILAVDEDDLKWVANEKNMLSLSKLFHENFRSKTPRCTKLSHCS